MGVSGTRSGWEARSSGSGKEQGQPVVGRDREVAELATFLDGLRSAPAAVLLEGEPGVGKTTLWEAGLAAARTRSYRVVRARAHEADSSLPYVVLGDLFEEVGGAVLSLLPPPRRRALESALLRIDPGEEALHQRTVSIAVLEALRILSRRQPVVIAVDDVQWIDGSSDRVLAFGLRRLRGEPVGLLGTARAPVARLPLGLDRADPAMRLTRRRIGPVSLGALRRIVAPVYGGAVPRPLLLKVHRVSGGNPLFAIELVRDLRRRPEGVVPGQPLPVPDGLRALLRDRIAEVPDRARRSLLTVAALGSPTRTVVEQGPGGKEGLRTALRAGVLTERGERLRPVHPLVGSLVYEEAPPEERREVHRRLAALVPDAEERARHVALATEASDEGAARMVEDGARRAASRGAPDAAAELGELAARLSSTSDAALRRKAQAAGHHFRAGHTERAIELLGEAASALPPGPVRGDVRRRLAEVRWLHGSVPAAVDLLKRAHADAGEDRPLRRAIERDLSQALSLSGDQCAALAHARKALAVSEELGDPRAMAEDLGAVGVCEFLRGGDFDREAMNRALAIERRVDGGAPIRGPSYAMAFVEVWTGDLDRSRERLEGLREEAEERGDVSAHASVLVHLALADCWGGRWDLAEQRASAAIEVAEETLQEPIRALALHARALVCAHRGEVEEAKAAIREGLVLADRTGASAAMVVLLSAAGFLELSLGNPAGAHEHLGSLAVAVLERGLRAPCVLRFVPDETEALLALGEPERARELVDPFERRARELDRPWALATAGRCLGLLHAASGDADVALVSFEEALRHHDRLEMPFERARTLLARGQVERRAKRWGGARASLESALEIFEQLGAPLWAERAREELDRIGGRPKGSTELTSTERRVAELVASGMSNREVADALFLSRRGVEANLTKIYRKLGIRGRTELAAMLSSEPVGR